MLLFLERIAYFFSATFLKLFGRVIALVRSSWLGRSVPGSLCFVLGVFCVFCKALFSALYTSAGGKAVDQFFPHLPVFRFISPSPVKLG